MVGLPRRVLISHHFSGEAWLLSWGHCHIPARVLVSSGRLLRAEHSRGAGRPQHSELGPRALCDMGGTTPQFLWLGGLAQGGSPLTHEQPCHVPQDPARGQVERQGEGLAAGAARRSTWAGERAGSDER